MNKTKNLLIEIGTEEMPFKQANYLSNYIKDKIKENLLNKNIDNIETYNSYTTNRLIIKIKNLPKKNKTNIIIKRGPPKIHCFKNNKPTNTLEKFLKSLKIKLSDLKEKKTTKGTWLIYIKTKKRKYKKYNYRYNKKRNK